MNYLILLFVSSVLLGLSIALHRYNRSKKALQKKPLEVPDEMIKEEIVKKFLESMCGPKRSYKVHDYLTLFEEQWLGWRHKKGLPACPDCEVGNLCEGPSGGVCMNIYCDHKLCGSSFNLVMGGVGGAQRVSDASPNKPLEMTTLGPHR